MTTASTPNRIILLRFLAAALFPLRFRLRAVPGEMCPDELLLDAELPDLVPDVLDLPVLDTPSLVLRRRFGLLLFLLVSSDIINSSHFQIRNNQPLQLLRPCQ